MEVTLEGAAVLGEGGATATAFGPVFAPLQPAPQKNSTAAVAATRMDSSIT
jgi:hypothetical protein